ncbi:MAG: hypothetical protein EOO22_16975 [Comamonadaceae bacterium]|nr:MAG: hypothetical protein EOO22_16975 [Comamonadaceae bacterium]
MNHATRTFIIAVWIASLAASTLAAEKSCHVEPFQGASLPQGAVARMVVKGAGKPCSIPNFGVPSTQENPSYGGAITKPPGHGRAEFLAPQAIYTPEPGYTGEDDFEYEAFVKGRVGQQLRLKVKVLVSVSAP